MAVEKAAETFNEVPKDLNLSVQEEIEDSKKLLEDVHVNDGTTGGSKEENKQDTLPEADLEDIDFKPEEYVFKSHIPASKTHIISTMSKLMSLRSNLSGLLLSLRLKSKAVSSLSSR